MRLYAISDIHTGLEDNMKAIEELSMDHAAGLILAGDVNETVEGLVRTLRALKRNFAPIFWVPGNHELWTVDPSPRAARGDAKYREMVEACRSEGVITPEDPVYVWKSGAQSYGIVPLFLLYDYSFKPPEISLENAVHWASLAEIVCADEHLLHPDPFASRQAWCASRCEDALKKLASIPRDLPLVLINHFPLRGELVNLPRIPHFRIWCGTERTENWHTRFNVKAVVYGHLHMRTSRVIDGVRFEEVSLGYTRQWTAARGLRSYLREILPEAA